MDRIRSAKALRKKCDLYFKACEGKELTDAEGNRVLDKQGYPIIVGKRPVTISGLCIALGIESRQELLNYEEKSQLYKDVINEARLRIEQYAEEQLYTKEGWRGAQVTLQCNFGWSNKAVEAESDEEDVSGVILIPRIEEDEQ